MPVGAPKGSSNRNKAQLWDRAVERALGKRGVTRLEALGELYDILEGKAKSADKDALAALLALLDRELGKPSQAVEVEHSGNIEFDIALQSAEELRKKIRETT